jgi:hypothetical protein
VRAAPEPTAAVTRRRGVAESEGPGEPAAGAPGVWFALADGRQPTADARAAGQALSAPAGPGAGASSFSQAPPWEGPSLGPLGFDPFAAGGGAANGGGRGAAPADAGASAQPGGGPAGGTGPGGAGAPAAPSGGSGAGAPAATAPPLSTADPNSALMFASFLSPAQTAAPAAPLGRHGAGQAPASPASGAGHGQGAGQAPGVGPAPAMGHGHGSHLLGRPHHRGGGGLAGLDPPISSVEGFNFYGDVADFTDSDGNHNPSLYHATVNWGDGTSASAPVSTNSSGGFSVVTGHVYTEASTPPADGPYTLTVTINDNDGPSTTITEPASVADANLDWLGGTYAPNVPPLWNQTPDTPPTVTKPADQSSAEGAAASLQVQASGGYALTYDALDLPPGLTINTSTGLISGTVGYGAAEDFGGDYTPIVTVSDGHGGSASTTFTWTVTDTWRAPVLTTPGNQTSAAGQTVSLQVSASDADGNPLSYDATGLPPGLSIDGATGVISGTLDTSAASPTPYSVSVSVDDGSGNPPVTGTFNWTVTTANQPPQLTGPGGQSNAAGATVDLPLSAPDPDGDALTYTATGLPAGLSIDPGSGDISGTLANSAASATPYSVTVTASDGIASSSQTFQWTVNFVGVTSPGDQSNLDGDAVSLQLTAHYHGSGTLSFSATGLPAGLTINGTTGLIGGTIAVGADASSPYAVTVTATDGTVSASQAFTWAVARVSLTNPGPQQGVDGQAVSLPLQGRDADGGSVTWSASGLPAGLGINSGTGLISGTLASNADAGSGYLVTLTASDGAHSTSQTFVWTVTKVGVTNPGDRTNTEGDGVSLQLQGLSAGGTLTYSASGLPDGLALNPATGLISGTVAPGAAADGPFTTTVAVTNGTVSASQQFTWTVNPVVTLTAPADQSNVEGNSVSLQLSATDTRGLSLTYTAAGLPAGLDLNASTGLISGTVSAGASAGSPYAVTVTASDGTYSSSEAFNWVVTHADTTALTLSNPGTQVNVASDGIVLPLSGSDPDGIDTLTYSATGLPDGLSIDPSTGLVSGVVANDAVSAAPYAVTVTADDGNGQTASRTFTWVINDAPLAAQAVPVNAVEGNDTGTITVATFTTTDLNYQAGDFMAVVDWGDDSSDTASVTGQSGSFTVTDDHTYAETGVYPVTVTITDSNGTTATAAATATVADAPLSLAGGLQFGNAPVGDPQTYTLAVLRDGNPGATLHDYAISSTAPEATIDWGDGTQTVTHTFVANPDGSYSIPGTHSYSGPGPFSGPLYRTVTVTVRDVDGATATTTDTVVVGALYAGVPSLTWNWAFRDENTDASAGDYVYRTADGVLHTAVARIDWGDGTWSLGPVSGGPGQMNVTGTHTYAQDSLDQPGGVYWVTVRVWDDDNNDGSGPPSLIGQQTVCVVRPPMVLSVGEIEANAGQTLTNVEVATFTEPDTSDSTGEFAAAINWGDGTPVDTGAQIVGSAGMFHVQGSHTYAVDGIFPVSVVVSQGWRQQLAAEEGDGEAQAGTET